MGTRLLLCILLILHLSNVVQLSVLKTKIFSHPRNIYPFLEESDAAAWLVANDPVITAEAYKFLQSKWNFVININPETKNDYINASTDHLLFKSEIVREIEDKFPNWQNFQNETLKRAFNFMHKENHGNDPEALNNINQILADMEEAHGTTKICEYGTGDSPNCNLLRLVPDVEARLRQAESVEESEYYWTAWHSAVGSAVTQTEFQNFVEGQNRIADLNGLKHMGETWALPYLSEDATEGWPSPDVFKEAMDRIWTENFKEPYEILHEYVRMKLRENSDYSDLIGEEGTIPAHLFGNMWAQDWGSLAAWTKPFPEDNMLNLTAEMQEKDFVPQELLKIPEGYLIQFGGGLDGLPSEWRDNSKYENLPENAECYPMTQDFRTSNPGAENNIRIKMCTQIDDTSLMIAFRKLLNLNYFRQFGDASFKLTQVFRQSANPGVLDAIGGAASLSAMTPCGLLRTELNGSTVECESTSHNTTSNYSSNNLYLTALKILPAIASAYALDTWRWKVYTGEIKAGSFNREFWNIRREVMRIVPPAGRDIEEEQLDAAAYYVVSGNVEMFKDFMSHILQFQIYGTICTNMGFYPTHFPLHECNFLTYTPTPEPWKQLDVGENFAYSMSRGFSEPWEKVFKNLTGGATSGAYFQAFIYPLVKVLTEEIGPIPTLLPPTDPSTTENLESSSIVTDNTPSTTQWSSESTILDQSSTSTHSTSELLTTDSEMTTEEGASSPDMSSSSVTESFSTTVPSETTETDESTVQEGSSAVTVSSSELVTTESGMTTVVGSSSTYYTTDYTAGTSSTVSISSTISTGVTPGPGPNNFFRTPVSLEMYIIGSILMGSSILVMLLHLRTRVRWHVELPCEEPW